MQAEEEVLLGEEAKVRYNLRGDMGSTPQPTPAGGQSQCTNM
jgi:hypothetical protein